MSKATFAEAVQSVLSERVHQRHEAGDRVDSLPVALLLTLATIEEAAQAWAKTRDDEAAKLALRSIAARCVGALEAHGAPLRPLPADSAQAAAAVAPFITQPAPAVERSQAKYDNAAAHLRNAKDEARIVAVWNYVEGWAREGWLNADDVAALGEAAQERRRQLAEAAAEATPAKEVAPDAIP